MEERSVEFKAEILASQSNPGEIQSNPPKAAISNRVVIVVAIVEVVIVLGVASSSPEPL